MSRTFSTNNGSDESLKVSTRCGCSPNALQMRCTVEGAVGNLLGHGPSGSSASRLSDAFPASAISLLLSPAAAARTMRARSANACGAPCLRASAPSIRSSFRRPVQSPPLGPSPFSSPCHGRENVNDLSIRTLTSPDIPEGQTARPYLAAYMHVSRLGDFLAIIYLFNPESLLGSLWTPS